MYIDAFCTMIGYRRYRFTNRSPNVEPDADLSLHTVKHKVYLLY